MAFDFRFAENNSDVVLQIAMDLVRRRTAVIVVPGSAVAVRAVMSATMTIPIIFMNASDPVQAGLVASLNRPGGNVTGITDLGLELAAKRLGLLHELLPQAMRVAALLHAANAPQLINELHQAAAAIPLELEVVSASTRREIDACFETVAQKQADALWVGPSALFFDCREQSQDWRHVMRYLPYIHCASSSKLEG